MIRWLDIRWKDSKMVRWLGFLFLSTCLSIHLTIYLYAEKQYKYNSKYRDPLIPVYGGGSPVIITKSKKQEETTQKRKYPELTTFTLKGILKGSKSKFALLKDNTGQNYTLREGKLFDKKDKIINGVAGVIKEKSVLLFTDKDKVELKIKKEEKK